MISGNFALGFFNVQRDPRISVCIYDPPVASTGGSIARYLTSGGFRRAVTQFTT